MLNKAENRYLLIFAVIMIIGISILGSLAMCALPSGGTPATPIPEQTEVLTAPEWLWSDNFTQFNNVAEIRQFVKDSGFSEREYKFGTYDCINREGDLYFGFALDFVRYAKTQNRQFIPFAEYTKGGKTWHLKTITLIGNKVYSVDPIYYDGRVYLFGKVD